MINIMGGGIENPNLNPHNILEENSPLFAKIDTISPLLFESNICPYLPKLYGIYKSFDEIDFRILPHSFVIKTNHDCGGVIIVPNKEEFCKILQN